MLWVEGVGRSFAGVRALDDVTFTVDRGERHAVIGPNGAGKSTLFAIIGGQDRPTDGHVAIDGHTTTGTPPDRLARSGVSRTFQQSACFLEDSVLDNATIAAVGTAPRGRWGAWRSLGSAGGARAAARGALAAVGLADRAGTPAGALSHGERRQLEIAMALAQGPRVLLADEPLAGLAEAERAVVGDVLRALPDDLTVLFVEHDLRFAMALADRTTVLHQGRVVASGPSSAVRDDPEVVRVYTGGAVLEAGRPARIVDGPERLAVDGLVAGYGDTTVLEGASLSVRRGEVVALLGRNGMGKTTLLSAVMGLVGVRSGSIRLGGQAIDALPTVARADAGLALVPQGRHIIPGLTVEEQLRLGQRPGPWGLDRVFATFDVLADRRRITATSLSGGEQQMLAIARALLRNPDVLLLDEPSEGLSPRVLGQVRDLVLGLADAGETILLAEQNVELALAVADRVCVLEQGAVVAEATPAELRADPDRIRRSLHV